VSSGFYLLKSNSLSFLPLAILAIVVFYFFEKAKYCQLKNTKVFVVDNMNDATYSGNSESLKSIIKNTLD